MPSRLVRRKLIDENSIEFADLGAFLYDLTRHSDRVQYYLTIYNPLDHNIAGWVSKQDHCWTEQCSLPGVDETVQTTRTYQYLAEDTQCASCAVISPSFDRASLLHR